jgi:peroxiredoxin Q/BCP
MSNAKPDVGDKAPAFDLPGAGGGSLSLAAARGRKTLLYFYPKDDTSGCTKEAIDFTALKKDFDKANTEVIGVSPDPVKSHDKFKTKHELAVALASDEARSVIEAYGVWVEKSLYGRKYMGVERATFLIGADGVIKKVWRKVKVPGHAAAALEAAKTV